MGEGIAMFDVRMVVYLMDDTSVAGYGGNFLPSEAEILLKDLDDNIRRIPLSNVKKICFVRHFSEDSQSVRRAPEQLQYQPVPGRKVGLHFRDGQSIYGIVTTERKPDHGFFLTPLNPNSNNLSIYVNPDALLTFNFLD